MGEGEDLLGYIKFDPSIKSFQRFFYQLAHIYGPGCGTLILGGYTYCDEVLSSSIASLFAVGGWDGVGGN